MFYLYYFEVSEPWKCTLEDLTKHQSMASHDWLHISLHISEQKDYKYDGVLLHKSIHVKIWGQKITYVTDAGWRGLKVWSE